MAGPVTVGKEVGDFISYDAGLARACTGHDEFGTAEVFDGGALGIVELFEIIGRHQISGTG